jgi:hypothetical protein
VITVKRPRPRRCAGVAKVDETENRYCSCLEHIRLSVRSHSYLLGSKRETGENQAATMDISGLIRVRFEGLCEANPSLTCALAVTICCNRQSPLCKYQRHVLYKCFPQTPSPLYPVERCPWSPQHIIPPLFMSRASTRSYTIQCSAGTGSPTSSPQSAAYRLEE